MAESFVIVLNCLLPISIHSEEYILWLQNLAHFIYSINCATISGKPKPSLILQMIRKGKVFKIQILLSVIKCKSSELTNKSA